MPECAKCKASVPTHAKVCPRCGAPADISVRLINAPSLDPDDTVHSLLLNAHLLKIRGDSDAAISECIKALRINPDSLEAHTLLGDIYRNQGKVEDAVHWYKLALDLNPGNRSNLERLDQLTTQRQPPLPKPTASEPTEDKPPVKPSPFNVMAAMTIIVCLLAVSVIVLLIKLQKPAKDVLATPAVPYVQSTPTATFRQPETKPSASGDEPKIEAKENADTTPTDPDTEIVRDLNEGSELKAAKLQVVSSTYDPRNDVQYVTFINPEIEGGISKPSIVQHSLIVAKATFAQEKPLTSVTIRVLYRLPYENSSKLLTVFIGDITEEKAAKIEPASTPSAEQSAFENTWWRQDVK